MTEFLKDFHFVKGLINKSYDTVQIMEAKRLIGVFQNKYIGQVSHMDPIYIKHVNELNEAFNEKFRKLSAST